MSPDELRAHRTKYGLSRAELGTILGVSPHTIKQWEIGRRRIPPMVELALASSVPQVHPTRICRAYGRTVDGREAQRDGATLTNAIDSVCQELRTDWRQYTQVVQTHHVEGNRYQVFMGRRRPNGDVITSPDPIDIEVEYLDHAAKQDR